MKRIEEIEVVLGRGMATALIAIGAWTLSKKMVMEIASIVYNEWSILHKAIVIFAAIFLIATSVKLLICAIRIYIKFLTNLPSVRRAKNRFLASKKAKRRRKVAAERWRRFAAADKF